MYRQSVGNQILQILCYLYQYYHFLEEIVRWIQSCIWPQMRTSSSCSNISSFLHTCNFCSSIVNGHPALLWGQYTVNDMISLSANLSGNSCVSSMGSLHTGHLGPPVSLYNHIQQVLTIEKRLRFNILHRVPNQCS